MPTFQSLFTQLPSTPPPGSSHCISNAIIIAQRIARGFAHPVRIEYSSWRKGNPFYDWAQRHTMSRLKTMQLRKEQKQPFFHEYVTFELGDGRYFRIDRRQLPNEDSPMDCTTVQGVEAYDTIEQIPSLNDSIYGTSDCLVEVHFRTSVDLSVIIGVCRRLSVDGPARVYTVQRYNCYFYAQTVLLCAVLGAPPDNARPTVSDLMMQMKKKQTEPIKWFAGYIDRIRPDILIQVLDIQPAQYPSSDHESLTYTCQENSSPQISDAYELFQELPAQLEYTGGRWAWLWGFSEKGKESPPVAMRALEVNELLDYVSTMIRTHSLRVQQYQVLLNCSAEEVERDVKQTMQRIW